MANLPHIPMGSGASNLLASDVSGTQTNGSVVQLVAGVPTWTSTGGALAAEANSGIMLPSLPTIAMTTIALPATFQGGIYTASKPLTLTVLWLRATAATAGAVVRVAIYQKSDGTLGGALPQIFTGDSAALPAGASNFSLAVASVTLATGQYVVLTERVGAAAVTLRAWTNVVIDLFSANLPAGRMPFVFTTALAGASPPSFDPLVSGVAAASVCPHPARRKLIP